MNQSIYIPNRADLIRNHSTSFQNQHFLVITCIFLFTISIYSGLNNFTKLSERGKNLSHVYCLERFPILKSSFLSLIPRAFSLLQLLCILFETQPSYILSTISKQNKRLENRNSYFQQQVHMNITHT